LKSQIPARAAGLRLPRQRNRSGSVAATAEPGHESAMAVHGHAPSID